jgi:hypothetical protein
MGFVRQRVHQIQHAALKKLRRMLERLESPPATEKRGAGIRAVAGLPSGPLAGPGGPTFLDLMTASSAQRTSVAA